MVEYQGFPQWINGADGKLTEIKITPFLGVAISDGRPQMIIKGKVYQQCLFLLTQGTLEDMKKASDEIEETGDVSIDMFANKTSMRTLESQSVAAELGIPVEEQLKAHAGNLCGWVELDYNSCAMESTLAFRLLKALGEAGDKVATNAFYAEIERRLRSGIPNVVTYIIESYQKESLEVIKYINDNDKELIARQFANRLTDTQTGQSTTNQIIKFCQVFGPSKVLEDEIENIANKLGDSDVMSIAKIFPDLRSKLFKYIKSESTLLEYAKNIYTDRDLAEMLKKSSSIYYYCKDIDDAEYIYSKIDAEPFILLYTRDIAYRPEVFSKLKSPDFIFSFFDAIVKDKISKKVVTSSIDELIKLPEYKVLIDRMVDAQPVADLKQEEIDGFRQRFCDEIIDIKGIRNVIKKVPVKKSTTKKSKN